MISAVPFVNFDYPGAGPRACPCCGSRTLSARVRREICPVCRWEDDGQDSHDDALVRGTVNGRLSLAEVRRNFTQFGACDRSRLALARPPRPEDGIQQVRNVFRPVGTGPHACPCCGYLTLVERGGYEICSVCRWEDDGQDDHDADENRGAPNKLSLTDGPRNFVEFTACELRGVPFVRAPLDEEYPR